MFTYVAHSLLEQQTRHVLIRDADTMFQGRSSQAQDVSKQWHSMALTKQAM